MTGLGLSSKVVPFPVTAATGFRSEFAARMTKGLHAWHATQLSHYGGKYSIERMLALEEYSRTTSSVRVFMVIISLPVVLFAVVICQEVVPLQNPREGWQANYGFWVRVLFAGIAAAYAVAAQVGYVLDIPPLSLKQQIAYCVCCGASFLAMGMALAAVTVFPVPFFILSLSMISALLLVIVLRVVLGSESRSRIASQRELWLQFFRLTTVNGSMCAGYPVYQVLFTKANHTSYELPVLLILPLLKFVLKLIFMSVTALKEDTIPEEVVFSVNFFDILYLVTFMQTISSTTMTVIMVMDIIHSAMSLFSLHKRTREIASNLREVFGADIATTKNFDLLNSVRSLCNHRQKFYSQMRPDIRIRSCTLHQLSSESTDLLKNLEKHLLYNSSSQQYRAIGHQTEAKAHTKRNTAISIPSHTKKKAKFRHSDTVALVTRIVPEHGATANNLVLHEALESLFTSECLILAEYVEFVVPLLYGAYVLMMVHLQSARYHSEMAGVTIDNIGRSVSGIFSYALLEFASFVVLAIITRRNCGIRVLYQLAFVLETQVSLVFSKVILWTLLTLTYRVVHFGADFTFRFQWIHNQS